MVLQHNMMSNFTQRELKLSMGDKSKSTEKLASGYRINRAADDAAGLSISEKMRWNIRGLNKAANNCQDGSSMMQVADGALAEVHEMLNRMKELSVQAANDSNTEEDRQAIQREMNQLVEEIDRIGDTTEFNTMKLFQGSEVDVVDQSTGRRISSSDIPISDFSVSDLSLIGEPFSKTSRNPANELNLGVALKGDYNVSGTQYPLIYKGSYAGSTSSTRFYYALYDEDRNLYTESENCANMKVTDISHTGDTYTRTFLYESSKYDDIKYEIKQNVTIGQNDGVKQGYSISYDISNLSSSRYTAIEASILMNIDTAYGGTHQGDLDESYFTNGNEVDKFGIYTDIIGSSNCIFYLDRDLSDKVAEIYLNNGFDDSLRSFSVFDLVNPELPFSEYVEVNDAHLLAFGRYGSNVQTLEDLASGGGSIGSSTAGADKTFTALWTTSGAVGYTNHIDALELGIKKKEVDSNLKGFDVGGKTGRLHSDRWDLWIQSGATQDSGFFIGIEEMNSTVLGLRDLDVTSYEAASDANDRIDKAINNISAQRTIIGSQQNRLETASKVDANTSENTQYAESRIRDTDMADEMVNFSKHNIVEQVGQSMLSQANNSTQGVLSLLG